MPTRSAIPRSASLRTVGAWADAAGRAYARHGAALGQVASTARDEALFLILRTLKLPLDSDARVLEKKLGAAERKALGEAFDRRLLENVPAAYLTGEAWFGGLRFHVDERVLIPRSYFVEIIPHQLDLLLRRPGAVRRVADVCTGSGCLAILLARHFPKARVDATDVSVGALAVAEKNVRLHRLSSRVKLFRSDVLEDVPAAKYDIILSNPPYEPSARVAALPLEFRKEPGMALDGGRDGLDIIRRLIPQALGRLAPDGLLLIEVGGLRRAIDREFEALHPQWLETGDASDCVCLFRSP